MGNPEWLKPKREQGLSCRASRLGVVAAFLLLAMSCTNTTVRVNAPVEPSTPLTTEPQSLQTEVPSDGEAVGAPGQASATAPQQAPTTAQTALTTDDDEGTAGHDTSQVVTEPNPPTTPDPNTGTSSTPVAATPATSTPGTSTPATSTPGTSTPTATPTKSSVAVRETEKQTDRSANDQSCTAQVSDNLRLSAANLRLASFEVSAAVYGCALEVAIAHPSDIAAIAALKAHGISGPLLLAESLLASELHTELTRLGPNRVVVAGYDAQTLNNSLSGFNFESLQVDRQAPLPNATVSYDIVYLVDNSAHVVPLAFVGEQLGFGVVAVGNDLGLVPSKNRKIIGDASRVVLLADFGGHVRQQLRNLRGLELPGGGLRLFEPGHNRRLVAMYGNPLTRSLGVLGEQGAEASIVRLRTIAEGYDADGATVLPTFEIIATVASASAGRDGDYSNETALDVIRPWIEIAAANDVYVVLDLQPGRSDFLSQAKIYEEFLRQPHVGLALDPEWRLKPHQRHLRQIGTVDAAEINQVVDWLAALVRREALPQKLLVLHQFKLAMITNRHLVKTPAELAVLIHMDGQGPLSTKYSTWNTLTSQPDADRFYWGWKNFYDEDFPRARADQVLGLTPKSVFVSYQ